MQRDNRKRLDKRSLSIGSSSAEAQFSQNSVVKFSMKSPQKSKKNTEDTLSIKSLRKPRGEFLPMLTDCRLTEGFVT